MISMVSRARSSGLDDVVERAASPPSSSASDAAVALGLVAPGGIEGNVALPLVALGDVPVGLAVPDEVERDAAGSIRL